MNSYFRSAAFRNDLMGAIGVLFLIAAGWLAAVAFTPGVKP
jgi:hypothetical protein